MDPWRPTVAVPGFPVVGVGGTTQLYQGAAMVIAPPYGFTGQLPAAANPVHQTPVVGPTPFTGTPWPPPLQQQQQVLEYFNLSE